MESKSLFKVQSIVTIVLVTGVIAIGFAANADDTAASASNGIPTDNSTLAALLKGFGSSTTDPCNSQNELLNTDASNISSAQSQLIEAQKSQADDQLGARTAISNAALDQTTSSNSYASTVAQIQAKFQTDSSSQQDKNAQAIQKIRTDALALQTSISTSNQKLRAAEDAVANSNTDQESSCRNAADKAGNDKKNAIDAAYANAKTTGQQINYGTSGLAGADNRRKAKRIADIQNEYMTAYANCMNGSSGPGADAKAAMAKAQQALTSAKATWAEEQQQIAAQQKALQDDLALAQKSGQTALANLATAEQATLNAAYTQYQNQMAKDNTAVSQANDKLMTNSQFDNQAVQFGMTNLGTANQRAATASAGVQACLQKNAAAPKSDDDDEDSSDDTPPAKTSAPAKSGNSAH